MTTKRYRLWALWLRLNDWCEMDVVAARTHREATAILREMYPRWMSSDYAGRWKVSRPARRLRGQKRTWISGDYIMWGNRKYRKIRPPKRAVSGHR